MLIDKLSGSKVRFEITVTKELFEHALDHAFEEMNQKVEIKGFRKGHAPRTIYEAKYGIESLYEEAVNHAIQDTYYDAIVENDLKVVAQPKINFDFKKVKRGEDFIYEVVVAVKPDVTLGQYKGLEIERASETATDIEINAEIETELEKHAEMILKETGALADGDTAVFDFSGSVDGVKFDGGTAENYELKIGSGQFIPGFEAQMIGMTVEAAKDLKVTFPETYQEKTLAGKEAVFAVKLHEIKQRLVPALSEDLVKELELPGVETIEQYRDHIKSGIELRKRQSNENALVDQVVRLATDNATFEVPEEMVSEEAGRMQENAERQIKQYKLDFDTYLKYMGKTKEEYEAGLKAEALRTVKSQLVVEAVGKAEGLLATKEEIEAKYLEIVEQYKSQNVTIEQAKNAIPETSVTEEVVFHKALDFLVKNVVFKN
ncbi:MAG: trigger factor [Tenericutes bacterium GWF2_57_13]|nr:MAG: trigger factor [Tenericutes bacterium GWF2_57_13]